MFDIDSNLGITGFQGGNVINGIGSNARVGFAIYVKNVDQLRAISLDVTWNGAQAAMVGESGFGIDINDRVVNGGSITLSEDNVMGDFSGIVVADETGRFAVDFAKLGGTAVATTDYGLVYCFVLRTVATFKTSDSMTVNVKVKALNDANVDKDLGVKFFYVNTVSITEVIMVSIPGGTFNMGQTGIERAEPVHTVTVSSFEMGKYEITQGQYKSIIGTNPSSFTGDDNQPIDSVSWWDAIKFCNALSRSKGLEQCYNEITGECDFTKNGFRLPTEAEWEYACRAGTTTAYNTGNSESDLGRAGWYSGNSSSTPHPVGQKTPNNWALYDMHGNVYEWCHDWYGSYTSGSQTNPTGAESGSQRVLRSSSWISEVSRCLSTSRGYNGPTINDNYLGFRVVRRP